MVSTGDIFNAADDLSKSVTGKTFGDAVGNATVSSITAATSFIPLPEAQRNKIAEKVVQNVKKQIQGGVDQLSGKRNASGFGDVTPPKKPTGTDGGGGAGPRKYDMVKTADGYFPVGRVAYGSEPYSFTLNTGIPAPVYAPTYLQSSTSLITLNLTSCYPYIPSDSYTVSQFIQTIVYQYFSNSIQRAISFSIPTGTFTTAGFINWLNYVIQALMQYFWYKSVLAYAEDPLNKNDGMLMLRQLITASDLNSLYELERVLLGIPLPPNLVNLCWWMNQNVVNGNMPNMAINKVLYPSLTYTSTTGTFNINTTNWYNITANLLSVNSISNVISRATPWLVGSLPSYPSSPVYDENFLTFFNNIGSAAGTTAAPVRYPSISSSTLSVNYNSWTNLLDGAAFAFMSIYDTTNAKWLPNLLFINPIADTASSNIDNRFSYYNGELIGCSNYNANFAPVLSACRGDTYFTTSAGNTSINVIGTQPVYGVNESSISQAAQQLAEWMLSIDTIGYIKDNRNYDSMGRNSVGVPGKRPRR